MSRTIRDYEFGKLDEIIQKAHKFNAFEHIEDLKWHPITKPPLEGQRIMVSLKGRDVEVGYFADGMFFHEGWDWAQEFSDYDGWMSMPLPMNLEED